MGQREDKRAPRCVVSRRGFCLLGAAALTLFAKPLKAFAAIWDPVKTYTKNGVVFTYKSGLDTSPTKKATTTVVASKTVSAGTMRAKAILVGRLDKQVLASSGWASNAKGATLTATVTSKTLASGYRSKGKVECYGKVLDCSASPAGYALDLEPSANGQGQAYGTYEDIEAGYALDLVSVLTDSGIAGYAYWDQFDSAGEGECIPVYAVDGETRIGTFTFGDR